MSEPVSIGTTNTELVFGKEKKSASAGQKLATMT